MSPNMEKTIYKNSLPAICANGLAGIRNALDLDPNENVPPKMMDNIGQEQRPEKLLKLAFLIQ